MALHIWLERKCSVLRKESQAKSTFWTLFRECSCDSSWIFLHLNVEGILLPAERENKVIHFLLSKNEDNSSNQFTDCLSNLTASLFAGEHIVSRLFWWQETNYLELNRKIILKYSDVHWLFVPPTTSTAIVKVINVLCTRLLWTIYNSWMFW